MVLRVFINNSKIAKSWSKKSHDSVFLMGFSNICARRWAQPHALHTFLSLSQTNQYERYFDVAAVFLFSFAFAIISCIEMLFGVIVPFLQLTWTLSYFFSYSTTPKCALYNVFFVSSIIILLTAGIYMWLWYSFYWFIRCTHKSKMAYKTYLIWCKGHWNHLGIWKYWIWTRVCWLKDRNWNNSEGKWAATIEAEDDDDDKKSTHCDLMTLKTMEW